jgi:hypothetical protein
MSPEGSDLDKYLSEIKRIGADLEQAIRKAASDMDRIGRDVLNDTVENARLGGKEAEQALLRLEKELKEGGPHIKKEMDDLQRRMNETASRVEQEIRRRLK